MHISGDNRFLVATWRRAGSVAICNGLISYMHSLGIDIKWFNIHSLDVDATFNQQKDVLCHTHSINQLKLVSNNSIVFLAIRNPSEAAISNEVAGHTGFWHVYSNNFINNIKIKDNKKKFEQQALEEHELFLIDNKFALDIDKLSQYRNLCIQWNNDAFSVLKNIKFNLFNYNYWNGDVISYLNNINIKPSVINVVKNPKGWEDYVTNKDQVIEWINSNMEEDNTKMEQWSCLTS